MREISIAAKMIINFIQFQVNAHTGAASVGRHLLMVERYVSTSAYTQVQSIFDKPFSYTIEHKFNFLLCKFR